MKSKYVCNNANKPYYIINCNLTIEITSTWPFLRMWIRALCIVDHDEMVAVIWEILL